MFCRYCGNPIGDGEEFCRRCGRRVVGDQLYQYGKMNYRAKKKRPVDKGFIGVIVLVVLIFGMCFTAGFMIFSRIKHSAESMTALVNTVAQLKSNENEYILGEYEHEYRNLIKKSQVTINKNNAGDAQELNKKLKDLEEKICDEDTKICNKDLENAKANGVDKEIIDNAEYLISEKRFVSAEKVLKVNKF